MLRISRNNLSDKEVTPVFEGCILNHCIDQLRRVCEDILAQGHQLTIDLSGVSFVSRKGVGVLQDFQRRHVAFANCSVFVGEQLRSRAAGERKPGIDKKA